MLGASCPGSPKRDPETATSSRQTLLPPSMRSVSGERSQQPQHAEESTSRQSLDNPQGGAETPMDAVLAAPDACHISKQPAKLQSASINDVAKRRAEGAEAPAHGSMHQRPRWGHRHASAVSRQLDVTSARNVASGQTLEPMSYGTSLSNASEAAKAHGHNSAWGKQDSLDQSRSAAEAKSKSRGRDSSPAWAGLPRHLDVQSALWRPPPPKARPLPPLPEFPVMRSMGLPSPSQDSARVQSLGAAMEISTLFADKLQSCEPKLLAEKAPGSEPDTPELLKEHKAGPPKRSSDHKSEAGSGDAGDARPEGSHGGSGSPLTAAPGMSAENARLQETLASLASLKLSLGSSSVGPECSITASSASARTLSAGHVSLEAGDMQQVAVSGKALPSKSICKAEERAADASSAGCGAASEACSRITDSTWIHNPAAILANGRASASPREGAYPDLVEFKQLNARKVGTEQCGRAPEMAQKSSLPELSIPAGASPSKEVLRKVPAAAGNLPQGPQQDGVNTRCLEDVAPSQQV